MITYQEIYDILRKEKYNESLQKLPKKFLEELANYLHDKKILVNKEQQKSLFSDSIKLTRKQLENALVIIKEIIDLREKKVLNLSFTSAKTGISKRDSENLLEHEKKLFEICFEQLTNNEKSVNSILENENLEKKEINNVMIRFKKDVPAFVGSDGNEIGPFKQGDVANLSKDICDILVADEKAAVIDSD